MKFPYVAAICPVYRQTKWLNTAVECWLRQTYPDSLRELLILDDSGEMQDWQGSEKFNSLGRRLWGVRSIPDRFDSIPEKYDYLLNEVLDHADVVFVWDAFDVYLPWHVQSAAYKCPMLGYVAHDEVLCAYPDIVATESGLGRSHGSFAISKFLLNSLGGWPRTFLGDYEAKMNRSLAEHGVRVSHEHRKGLSYVFRWGVKQGYLAKSLSKAIDSPFWYEDVARRTSPEGPPGSVLVQPGLDPEAQAIFKSLGLA